MNETRYLKVSCDECDGHVEYPVEAGGTRINCPHCGKSILLPLPEEEVKRSKRRLILIILLASFLVDGVAIYLYREKLLAAFFHNPPQAILAATNSVPKSAPLAPTPTNAAETSPVPSTNQASTNLPVPVAPAPKSLADLVVGKITLEKNPGSHLIHAVGTVVNNSGYQHFGVKVEIDLFDAKGMKLDTTAQDYIGILEPHNSWNFRALVPAPQTSAVSLKAIKEDN